MKLLALKLLVASFVIVVALYAAIAVGMLRTGFLTLVPRADVRVTSPNFDATIEGSMVTIGVGNVPRGKYMVGIEFVTKHLPRQQRFDGVFHLKVNDSGNVIYAQDISQEVRAHWANANSFHSIVFAVFDLTSPKRERELDVSITVVKPPSAVDSFRDVRLFFDWGPVE